MTELIGTSALISTCSVRCLSLNTSWLPHLILVHRSSEQNNIMLAALSDHFLWPQVGLDLTVCTLRRKNMHRWYCRTPNRGCQLAIQKPPVEVQALPFRGSSLFKLKQHCHRLARKPMNERSYRRLIRGNGPGCHPYYSSGWSKIVAWAYAIIHH